MANLITVTLLLFGIAAVFSKHNYTGYQIIRVHFSTDHNALDLLNELGPIDKGEVDLWDCEAHNSSRLDFMVSPRVLHRTLSVLNRHSQYSEVLVDDLGSLIGEVDEENQVQHSVRLRRSLKDSVADAILGRYVTFGEFGDWILDIKEKFTDILEVETLGFTHEGRPLFMLKIGRKSPCERPSILIDAGTHAREWISPATCVYLIHKLLDGHMRGDPEVTSLLEELQWHIIPMVNPDGYQYSHTRQRMWRGNRGPTKFNNCTGTDLNRNWDFHWGEAEAYSDPCHLLYPGDYPCSEHETKALSTYILRERENIKAYISLHSFRQAFLSRWAYTIKDHPEHDTVLSLAEQAVTEMGKEGGEEYTAGKASEILYPFSGGSADWVAGVANITYSYTIQLRDKGLYGNLLPANYIQPVGEETWTGLRVVAQHIIREHPAVCPQKPSTVPPTRGCPHSHGLALNVGVTTHVICIYNFLLAVKIISSLLHHICLQQRSCV